MRDLTTAELQAVSGGATSTGIDLAILKVQEKQGRESRASLVLSGLSGATPIPTPSPIPATPA